MKQTKYLVAAAAALAAFTVSAQQFQSDGLSFKVLSAADHTLQLTASNPANPTELTLPDTVVYEGAKYTVVSIGEKAFDNNNKLATVTLPATLRFLRCRCPPACACSRRVVSSMRPYLRCRFTRA